MIMEMHRYLALGADISGCWFARLRISMTPTGKFLPILRVIFVEPDCGMEIPFLAAIRFTLFGLALFLVLFWFESLEVFAKQTGHGRLLDCGGARDITPSAARGP